MFSFVLWITLLNVVAGDLYRAYKENWNFSFLTKSYANWEFLNVRKNGVFAIVQLAIFFAIICYIFLLPTVRRYCVV